jgi:diguanylate cyclase (GGDEF)-like protein
LKQYQEYFEQLALMDPLTRLPNRRHLLQTLKKSLSISSRHRQLGALLFIDLDKFKPVNDQHGHAVGDALLQAVAKRFSNFLRAEDTAARIGGDEFIILLGSLNQDRALALEEARAVGEKTIAYLEQPFDVNGHSVEISASIGITLFPSGDLDGDELLKQADAAMYAAKKQGRQCVMVYHELSGEQHHED